VELLFAIVAVVLGGVWLLSAYNYSLHLSEVAQQSNVALNDLRDMMERIKTTPFTQLANDFPNGVANGGAPDRYGVIINGAVGVYTLTNEQITVTHSPTTAADPREMIVVVTWMNRGRQYQRQISTVRASQAS
jgi:hypothetical protein